MNRRTFLISSSAAALAATLPLPALPAPTQVGVDVASGPDLLAFTVGTPGEFDWQVVFARSAREALLKGMPEVFRRYNRETHRWEMPPDAEIDVDGYEDHFERVSAWDNRDPASITPADWLRIGFGYSCDRCGEPACQDSGLILGDVIICEDCTTFADRVGAGDWDWIEDELANRIESAADLPEARGQLERDGHLAALEAAGVWSKVVARVEADG